MKDSEQTSLLKPQNTTTHPDYGTSPPGFLAQGTQSMNSPNLPTYEEAMSFPFNGPPTICDIPTSNSPAMPLPFSEQPQNFSPLPGNIILNFSTSGVSSSDPKLNNDPNLLFSFFHSNNQRPRMWIDILGYEIERITEDVHTVDSEGRAQVVNETRDQTKTYFQLSYDVSQFISSTGVINNHALGPSSKENVMSLLEEHVSDLNKLKKIVLQKEVQWDYKDLTRALTAAIRHKGFRHMLSITYHRENHILEVTSSSKLSQYLLHPLSKVLCFISCLCIVAWPIALLYRRKHERKLVSTFGMSITPEEWYNRTISFIMTSLDDVHYF